VPRQGNDSLIKTRVIPNQTLLATISPHPKSQSLLRSAFEQESAAAELTLNLEDAEPKRSILHRSAAALAIDCGELQAAERLITRALAGNPPSAIATELKDLFIQINLPQYYERQGLSLAQLAQP
jgi:hypothetical protein